MGNDIVVLNGYCTEYIKEAGYNSIHLETPSRLFDLDRQLNEALDLISKDHVRGVLLIGGADVDRRIYTKPLLNVKTLGDAINVLTSQVCYDKQDMLELMVAKFSPKPVFGFCRGFQELHVALSNEGWSPLVEHMAEHYQLGSHGAKFIRDADELHFKDGDTFHVNSLHHQGVYYVKGKTEREYPRMKVIAVSNTPTPTVEIATWKNFAGQKALGVQYHPEMIRRDIDLNLLKQVFN